MTRADMNGICQEVVTKRILRADAGGFTGSIFTLDIGDQLREVKHRKISLLEGDSGIMVWCAWRLFDKFKRTPLTSWKEDSEVGGPMTTGLHTLVDDVISKMEILSCNDATIELKAGKS